MASISFQQLRVVEDQLKQILEAIHNRHFDIHTDHVWDVLANDIEPLRKAIEYFLEHLYEVFELDTPQQWTKTGTSTSKP